MNKPDPSYNDLLSKNKDLSEKAENHAYELESVRNRHISDLQSLVRESEAMQVKINELEVENQELKATIEGYEMQNAGNLGKP